MELRHFRYFLAVAEELHFTRAATRLGISQPPLSQQIKQFEAEVGTALFQRLPHGVALTEAGARMLQDARIILRLAGDALDNARRAAEGETGASAISG
jgi:DNA-binding transcriptional LysR family regulator